MKKWGLDELKKYKKEVKRKVGIFDSQLKGEDGACFVIDEEVIKIYWSKVLKQKSCDLSKYSSFKIAFPKYYIQDEKYYYAEIMPYYPYDELQKGINLDTNIELLMKNYSVIIDEIKKFMMICMKDLGFPGNILYSNDKGFYLIDTTMWVDEDWSYATKFNIRSFDRALFTVLSNLIGIHLKNDLANLEKVYQSIHDSNVGKEFLEVLEANLRQNYNYLNFMLSFQNVVKKYFDDDIETIGDIKKYNKKLKGL